MKNNRSKWKLPPDFNDDNIRSRIITPKMVNQELLVYNGKKIKRIQLKVKHVGSRIGDIVHTKLTAIWSTK